MTQETLTAIKKSLDECSIYSLFSEQIGTPEDLGDEQDTEYALMFNVETDDLFFLHYATPDNSWAKTAESQNPWLHLGYISAEDILMGDPVSYVADELDYKFEQQQEMNNEFDKYNNVV